MPAPWLAHTAPYTQISLDGSLVHKEMATVGRNSTPPGTCPVFPHSEPQSLMSSYVFARNHPNPIHSWRSTYFSSQDSVGRRDLVLWNSSRAPASSSMGVFFTRLVDRNLDFPMDLLVFPVIRG